MGLLETLSSFLPDVNIDLDIVVGGDQTVDNSDRRVVVIDEGDGELVRRDEDLDVVDVGELDPEDRERAQEALRGEWESVEEIFRESTAEDKRYLEASLTDDQIQDTLEYFRPILPTHYYGTLEAALHMRKQMEMMTPAPRDWVRSRRRDIAEKYDGHTYQVINLCSAGYFDEGRYLRELYEEMRNEPDYREGDFADVFEQIASQRPFTIFVSGGDQPSDVKQGVYQRLKNREQYDVDVEFVDVRGMGQSNREKIEQALQRMYDEVGDFDIDIKSEQPELVVRIDSGTVELPD